MARALPEGFERRFVERGIVIARADLLPDLESLGLLGRDTLERVLEAGEPMAAGRGTVRRLDLPGLRQALLVRRLIHGGVLAGLLGDRYAGLARPLRELSAGARLAAAGAPVVAPAAVFARRGALPVWRAAVASSFEEGAVDALRWLRTDPSPRQLARAAEALGAAVRRFHDAGGHHPDLHLGNLLLRENEAGFEGLVVDLDRVRIAPPTPRSRMSELMRLLRSLRKRGVLEQVGQRGCARFFAAYCGGDRRLRRSLRARLGAERRRLAIHAWRFPTGGVGVPRRGGRSVPSGSRARDVGR